MGGKKPVGATPSRGSLHRYGSSRRHAQGHTHPPTEGAVAAAEETPVSVHTQTHAHTLSNEYSLFSGITFAHSGASFGHTPSHDAQALPSSAHARTTLAGDSTIDQALSARYRLSEVTESFVHTLCDSVGTQVAQSSANASAHIAALEQRVETLQHTVDALTRELGQLAAALAFVTQAQAQEQSDAKRSISSADRGYEDLQRTHERISTLEGRQSAIQSKISQLDNIFGSSTANWSKNVKRLKELYDRGGKGANGESADTAADELSNTLHTQAQKQAQAVIDAEGTALSPSTHKFATVHLQSSAPLSSCFEGINSCAKVHSSADAAAQIWAATQPLVLALVRANNRCIDSCLRTSCPHYAAHAPRDDHEPFHPRSPLPSLSSPMCGCICQFCGGCTRLGASADEADGDGDGDESKCRCESACVRHEAYYSEKAELTEMQIR